MSALLRTHVDWIDVLRQYEPSFHHMMSCPSSGINCNGAYLLHKETSPGIGIAVTVGRFPCFKA